MARKKVYDLLKETLGRNLTVTEQDKIRDAVNSYLESVTNYVDYQNTPRTHILICSECAAKKQVVGYKELKNAYKGKRRGFVAG